MEEESRREADEDDWELSQHILDEIRQETYTCLVCTCEITPQDSLWSCAPCHRVYHLDCIAHWSAKGSSTDDKGNWNCPSCNYTHRRAKFQFKCWCSKTLQPQVDPLNPGSCGQTCGAKLKGCVHRCTLPCHPGPHAQCNSLGPSMKCHCGNHESQWPCVMTPYKEGWHCEDECAEWLPCEVHKCTKVCHDGLCGKCQTFVEATCYCGGTSDMVKCHLRKPIDCGDGRIGSFKCNKRMEVLYDCQMHDEVIPCQKPFLSIKHCPLSSDRIRTCHCGKTSLSSLNVIRTTCTDRIPTCELPCEKKLRCGHKCQSVCHEGPCGPCFQVVQTKCQCQSHDFSVPCRFNQSKRKPTCSKKCFATLSCRRHYCENICCTDFKAAQTRERERKRALKSNAAIEDGRNSPQLNQAFSYEASHICLKPCGKILRCGDPEHRCKQTCHTGPCPTCYESTNEDLVCHCGATVVPAPVRCGTVLPECQLQCQRTQPCGHDPMPHNCHDDSRPCAKCTRTVEKWCNCGKKKVRAMCFQTDVFCAEVCGKQRSCLHKCSRTCHSDPCENVKCAVRCYKPRDHCSHPDLSQCHFPARCDDTKQCPVLVKVHCKCGRIQRQMPCGANRANPSCEDKLLDCETSCVLKAREEQLREAFGLDKPAEPKMADIPYDIENIVKVAISQPKWCKSIETVYLEFMRQNKVKRYNFKPMTREKRKFLYYLAEAYGLNAEAQDPEPHRSISLSKTTESKIPELSLSESVEMYQTLIKSASSTPQPVPPTEATTDSDVRVSKTEEQEDTPNVTYNSILIKDCIDGIDVEDLRELISYLINPKNQPLHNLHKFHFSELQNWNLKSLDGNQHLFYVPGRLGTSSVERELRLLIPYLKDSLATNHLAKYCELVQVNELFKFVNLVQNSDIENEVTDGVADLKVEEENSREVIETP